MAGINATKVWERGALVALIPVFALLGLALNLPAAGTSMAAEVPAPPHTLTGNWEPQTPYPTRFRADGVDMVTPTEAWAVAYTDVLHTTDGGATWENQPRPGNENLYSVDFFNTQNGIAMGNTTLYTRNGGDTWTQVAGVFGYDVEMADANLAFITDHRSPSYRRTTNGGATWTSHPMPSNISTIQCFDSLNCVASSPTGTYHSSDGGLTWSFVPGQGEEFASAYFVSHSRGWIVLNDIAKRTTDGGATWQDQTLPGGSWIYDRVFSDENNGWGVGVNMVRTTNGGMTWQEVPLPQESLPLWDVDFLDAQHGIAGGDSFIGTESVIITSSNGGATWARRTSGTINAVTDMVALDYDHAWASHDYGGKTTHTTDGGATWQLVEVGGQYIKLTGIDMADSLHGWTVGYHNTYLDGYIYRTSDGGVTWQQQFGLGTEYIRKVAVLDAQSAVIIGGRSNSAEQRTTDGGNTWHDMIVPINSFFYDVFFLDSKTGWMVGGNGGNIVKTTDGGDTWAIQGTPAQYTLSSIHFSDPNNGWAGGYYGTLIRTTNGGATWTLQDPRIPEYTHVLDVNSTSPMRGWIAGYGGGAESRPFVKYTTDGGANWIEHTPQVGPYDSFSALAFVDDEYGWAGGAGGAFLHTEAGPPTATPNIPTPTNTPSALVTNTSVATSTTTPVLSTTTATRTSQPSNTALPPTSIVPTGTPIAPTSISVMTNTPAAPTATSTACALEFSDVLPGDTFYPYVMCLACRGILGGYADGEFRPNNIVTRGQIAKIVSNAAGFTAPVSGQTFEDVPPTHPFYEWVERLAAQGVMGGYPCGMRAEEPCQSPLNLPYFRPGESATRGQLSKIVANAANIENPVSGQFYADVEESNPFYEWIMRLTQMGVMSGYACGGQGEPCDPQQRPYFRWGNTVTRGQAAKIVANTFFPNCQTP